MANEKDIIRKFSEHYQKQEVDQLVNLFAEDATYHDTFYGSFTGHAKIREMFEMFYRDGKHYVWDMRKIVAEAGTAMTEFFLSFQTTGGKITRKVPALAARFLGLLFCASLRRTRCSSTAQ